MEDAVSPSDADLIASFFRGDASALNALVARYLNLVFRFVVRMVGDEDKARDITQETFIKAWKALKSYDPERPFKVWILTVAKRTTIDTLRKKEALSFSHLARADEDDDFAETIADMQPRADAILLRQESERALQDLLATLPPKARAVVVMHDIEQLTFHEISEISSESLNTVKSRYRRAFLLLQERARPMRQEVGSTLSLRERPEEASGLALPA